MTYIGNNLTVQQYSPQIAYFSGNGTATSFTLPSAVVSSAQIIVTVANVVQNPSSAFTVSGTTLTFTSAPPSGTNNIWVEYTSLQTNTIAPSQGTVQNSSFGAVTAIPMTYGTIGAGDSSLMKNRIINGAMVIDQRNAGASVTPTTNGYTLDRWELYVNQSSKLSFQQNQGSITPPVGFSNYLGLTSLAATTVGSSDLYLVDQYIEGYNIADLNFGTANAKTVTLSFWVNCSLTGTFGCAFTNSGNGRSYPFTYTISSANTWQQINITIAGDTSGTWNTTNGTGLGVRFSLGTGSTYLGTAGSWQSAAYFGATGQTNLVATNGATWKVTGVQLEVGSSATGYEYRQYQQELALCQRYYQQNQPEVASASSADYYFSTSGGAGEVRYPLPVAMRTSPNTSTVTSSNAGVSTYSQMLRIFTTSASGSAYFKTLSAEL